MCQPWLGGKTAGHTLDIKQWPTEKPLSHQCVKIGVQVFWGSLCYCSVTKLCLTLCNAMDCSMPGSSVLHYLPEFAQIHIHWVEWMWWFQSSHPLSPPLSSCLQSFPASESSLMNRPFTSGVRNIGASASESVFPMNIQGWFHLGLTDLISLQSNRLSRVFSSTTT